MYALTSATTLIFLGEVPKVTIFPSLLIFLLQIFLGLLKSISKTQHSIIATNNRINSKGERHARYLE